MRIGLLFGSFDPIHSGHTAIARWALGGACFREKVVEKCEKVWFVLSPQNPLKTNARATFQTRAHMIELALEGENDMALCTVESELEQPNYTIHTIQHLQRLHPTVDFTILCGSDVIRSSHKWHRAGELHTLVSFTEYPRLGADKEARGQFAKNSPEKGAKNSPPLHNISSSEIRRGQKLEYLHPAVRQYLLEQATTPLGPIYNPELELGYMHYDQGDFGQAINHWQKCTGTRAHTEAMALIQMAQEILAYRYTDILNP